MLALFQIFLRFAVDKMTFCLCHVSNYAHVYLIFLIINYMWVCSTVQAHAPLSHTHTHTHTHTDNTDWWCLLRDQTDKTLEWFLSRKCLHFCSIIWSWVWLYKCVCMCHSTTYCMSSATMWGFWEQAWCVYMVSGVSTVMTNRCFLLLVPAMCCADGRRFHNHTRLQTFVQTGLWVH